MPDKRRIEIFSAGCAVCRDVVAMIEELTCESCEIVVLDMTDPGVAGRAKAMGVRSVPAVALDGALADCCAGGAPDRETLKAAGIGRPLS